MEYTLKRGDITAVTTDQGAELISLKDSTGGEYIWCGDAQYWAGRNPNLFPIVGNLKDNTILVDGNAYQMKRHGFARNSKFRVVEQREDAIVFELTENEDTLKVYPFSFTLHICHQLTDQGFLTRYEVTNTGERTMPFTIGGHTAFHCPLKDGLQFSDYRIVFDQQEDAYAAYPSAQGYLLNENRIHALDHTDTLPLLHENFAMLDTYIFEGLNSTGVSLLGPDGHGVRLDFAGMPMIAFWTAGAKKAPYLCIEPWHGCAAMEGESGEFADKHHCILLDPHTSRTLEYSVSIL